MKVRRLYIFIFCLSLFSLSCGKKPVFTEMATSRLRIVLKGTLESEKGYMSPFVTPAANSTSVEDSDQANDSVDDIKGPSEDVYPTKLMLDIAEIRLGGKKISNYRQTFSIALSDSEPFFNGEGIELKTDDPGDGRYDTVEIFFRKMIFDNAKIYKSTGSGFVYEKDAEVIFKEKTVTGFDFNQLMVNSYWDSLRKESDQIIRVFPMVIPIIGGLNYNKENNETVLEIRLVFKNFIKKYEYDYYDSGIYKVCHYYAPSDWLRDVRAGESDIGRNLHGVAKALVKGQTGSITVNNTSGGYVVAIPADEDISDYFISQDGKLIRDAVKGDLPLPPNYPGAYISAVLDYYLKYEKYKNDWNTKRADLDSSSPAGLSDILDKYEYYWDVYESTVKGTGYGLKIPPYVGYGTSVTFNEMAVGSYKFYRFDVPAYGQLNTSFTSLNGGNVVTINAGANTGF